MKQIFISSLVLLISLTLSCHADEYKGWTYKKLSKKQHEVYHQQTELNKISRAVSSHLADQFKAFIPSGKQSYGEYTWKCRPNSNHINVTARDKDDKLQVSASIFYHTDMSEDKRKGFSKKCLDYPAKRYKDKWAWVLIGNIEIRLGLRNKDLESDEIIDNIIKSFDLNKIKKL